MPRKRDYKELSDEELFDLIGKDKKAQNEFYFRYKEKVKWFLSKYRLDSLQREDLIQEGMIGLFNAIDTYDKSKGIKFSTYSSVCIKNRINNALGSLWNVNKKIDSSGKDLEEVTEEHNPEDDVMIGEVSEKIEQAVLNLADIEKRVLSMYLDKKTYQEIALSLAISTKKVDNILMKIKSKLGEKIKQSDVLLTKGKWSNKLKNSIHRGLSDEDKH
jgi:RNA polymerase sporulation-specific sigma factor